MTANRHLADASIRKFELDRDLVAAQGIHALGFGLGLIERDPIARVAVVIEDHLAIKLF